MDGKGVASIGCMLRPRVAGIGGRNGGEITICELTDDHVGLHGTEKPGHRVQLVAKAAGNFNEIRVSENSRLN